LASTGIAGKPESWFREPDLHTRARSWGIHIESDGSFSYRDFLEAAIVAGTTPNGVFGARIMWGTMDLVVQHLRDASQDPSATDSEVLSSVFGHTQFIYLQRDDVVAQAVSWAKAEQTNTWLKTEELPPGRDVHFDFEMIDRYVKTVQQHNAAWADWFETQDLTPLSLHYEDLVADAVSETRSILVGLGLDPAEGRSPTARSYLQGDAVNEEWIERYRAVCPES
jgi:LPS sulfotransferase NodH